MTINGVAFRTQAEAIEYIRAILWRNIGNYLKENDLQFVVALLDMHPRATEKIGTGVVAIKVRMTGSESGTNKKSTPCFFIEYVDGTEVDFSFYKCLNRPNNAKETSRRRLSAYRDAVDEQILAFKSRPALECGLCGKHLEGTFHIDHETPFINLVREFETCEGELPCDFDFHPITNHAMFRAVDHNFAWRWQRFHEQKARLRKACARCNLMRPRATSYQNHAKFHDKLPEAPNG